MIAILPVSATDSQLALLTPMLADRIEAYAKDHMPDVVPRDMAAGVMIQVWGGSPVTRLLALVDTETGVLVGHALATLEGKPPVLVISQMRADQKVGDGLKDAVVQLEQWARDAGVTKALLVTHKGPEEMYKKHGYRFARHIAYKELTV